MRKKPLILTVNNEKFLKKKHEDLKTIRNTNDIVYLRIRKIYLYPLCDHVFIKDVLKLSKYSNKKKLKKFTLYGQKFDFISYRKHYHFVCPICRHPTLYIFIPTIKEKKICCCAACYYEITSKKNDKYKRTPELYSYLFELLKIRRLIKAKLINKEPVDIYIKKYLSVRKKIENNIYYRLWKIKQALSHNILK